MFFVGVPPSPQTPLPTPCKGLGMGGWGKGQGPLAPILVAKSFYRPP